MTKDASSRTVFVITLGTGARRTAEWIHELNEQYDVDPRFRFITVESTSVASEGVPDEFLTIPLDTDSRVKKSFERAKDDPSVPYITHDHDLKVQGATRNPNVGRFLLEYHSRRVYEMITKELRSAVGPESSELSVWVLASLSGGTGAGTFPLVSAMTRQIATDVGDRYNVDVYLNGLATISELVEDQQRIAPNAVNDYFVNTSNSLHALSTLLALPDVRGLPTNDGPNRLEMPVAPDSRDSDGLLEPSFDVSTPPLDALFLSPIDEDRAQDSSWDGDERTSYLARVNYTLASTVLALSTTSGDNDLGNLYGKELTDRLYTVDAASVRASVEPALDLLRTEDEIFSVRSDIDQLESNVEGMETLRGDIESLRSAEVDSGSVPDLVEDISTALAGRASHLVEGVSSLDLTDASFETVEKQLARALSEISPRQATGDPFANDLHDNAIEDFTADRFVPHAAVGRYVFLKMVLARVEAELGNHAFEPRIEDLWEKNEEELTDEFAGLASADPSTKYEQAIDPFLAEHEAEVESKLDATSIISVRKRRRLRRELESIRETRQELKRLFQEYERLQELEERIATGELPALGSELQDTTALLDQGVELGTKLLRSKRNRLENLERTRDTFHSRVVDTTSGRISEIPLEIDSAESLSRETLEGATGLFDLVDAGLLDPDSILRETNRSLGLVGEPLEDNFHDLADNQFSRLLIPMASPENAEAQNLGGTTQPSMGAIMSNNDVNKRLDTGSIDAPFRLDFVALHGNVRLANSSEFRAIRQRWKTGELHSLLGEDVDLPHHLAYPELVPTMAPSRDFPANEDDELDEEVTP